MTRVALNIILMEEKSKRDEIIEVINKLFIYTDLQKWKNILDEVFTEKVWFDVSSLDGSKPEEMPAATICESWKKGLSGIDAVHHHAGNFLVQLRDADATVFCYATAVHYKKSATQGVREFVGSYDLQLSFTDIGWRVTHFKYNLRYIAGNIDLK